METALLLESTLDEVLGRMGFNAQVVVREAGPLLHADVELREGAGALIGNGGEGIEALEDIVRRIMRRHQLDAPRVVLDVNNYRREHAMELREQARTVADRVRRFHETHAFRPMPARERRVIHTELASRADVITESVGEGPTRHVVVRPAG